MDTLGSIGTTSIFHLPCSKLNNICNSSCYLMSLKIQYYTTLMEAPMGWNYECTKCLAVVNIKRKSISAFLYFEPSYATNIYSFAYTVLSIYKVFYFLISMTSSC